MNQLVFEIAASTATFLVLWALLGNYIFKQFFRVIEEREARTVGDEHEAQEKRNRTRVLQTQIDERLREARLDGIRVRDERVGHAKQEAQSIIDRAAQQASQELKRAELQIGELKSKALADAPAEAEKLSKLVIDRALSTEGSRTIH